MAYEPMTDREAYEESMQAHGFDDEIDIKLLRRAEDGRWRATCDNNTVWADTPTDALNTIADELRES